MAEEKVMDEETRKILTGLAPFSIKSTIDFVPESYQVKVKDADGKDTDQCLISKDFWPTFTVRPWSRKESNDSVKALMKFQTDTDDTAIRELCRKATVGWENLIDVGTMSNIPYESESDKGAKKDIFESFTLSLILDISHKIGNISGLNKHEKLALK